MDQRLSNELPGELQTWLHTQGWTVRTASQVVAGFAARAIYRLDVVKTNGETAHLVYKQLAPDRQNEWKLYNLLSPTLDKYAPRLIARIEEMNGFGLLLEDVGVPLKQVFQAASLPQQRAIVLEAVSWLTHMHLHFESISQTWLQESRLGPYPVSSSLAWVEESIRQVAWAADHGVGGISRSDVHNLECHAEQFYPHLETWMNGRSTLSHGNPHMENLLMHDGQLKLVDWEFTCVTIPQRDVAILLQDILDVRLHAAAYETFTEMLRQAGWSVDDDVFRIGWQACFFDNTLMMLSWEIFKHRQGHLSRDELERIVPEKLRWMDQSFHALRILGL